jgi:macrolide phosphotransferase
VVSYLSAELKLAPKESLKTLIIEYEKLGGKVWNKLYEQTLERAAASPLMYGLFALETQNESLIVGAKAQLGVI